MEREGSVSGKEAGYLAIRASVSGGEAGYLAIRAKVSYLAIRAKAPVKVARCPETEQNH